MGKWTLESITPSFDPLNGSENFGTNFKVKLRLAYAPSRLTPFKSPVLDWNEKITTLWHHDRTYWTFQTNMFTHNPSSPTFSAWLKRYIAAYAFVKGEDSVYLNRGTVEFYDKKGQQLSPDELASKPAGANGERAAVIREYLAKHGGVFVIEIHDIPSIKTNSPNKHVERLLLFDCGLEGDKTERVKAMQYLNVNTNQPSNTWRRDFQIPPPITPIALPTQGLRLVPAPDDVREVNKDKQMLFSGESL